METEGGNRKFEVRTRNLHEKEKEQERQESSIKKEIKLFSLTFCVHTSRRKLYTSLRSAVEGER